MKIINDKIFEVSRFSNICSFCIHLDSKEFRKCEAFNKLIPLDIWNGKNDHTEPYPNAKDPEDNGILFEAIEEEKE